jgi:predicted transcriptional regulator
MAADRKPLISDELLRLVQETARAQDREPSDVVGEALRKYLDEQSWLKFVERNEQRAKAMGLTENDVERLVTEYRAENHKHGR